MQNLRNQNNIRCNPDFYSGAAPAKINLFLAVKNRRPDDGYHELATVFLPLPGLCDTISIRPAATMHVECSTPQVPSDHRNLCWQAATAFAQAAGIAAAWRIVIEKRIPVAAGLGGGSSDAALVLLLLQRLTGRLLPTVELSRLACRLGADVPFFLDPRPAVACGIGEILKPISLACQIPLVLLNPGGFPLSAASAYATVQGQFDQLSPAPLLAALAEGQLADIARHTYNRFDQPIKNKVPLVDIFLEFLYEHNCLAAHVSGSGPTVYGICRTPHQAEEIARAAKHRFEKAGWVWHGTTGNNGDRP